MAKGTLPDGEHVSNDPISCKETQCWFLAIYIDVCLTLQSDLTQDIQMFTCTLVVGQVDHILFFLWYISIYDNLQRRHGKDIKDSSTSLMS